jgi:hypothetical protein
MPINPNIALSYRPPQFESPVDQMTNVLQMQNAQQSNQLNALGLQERQRSMESANALRGLFAQPDFDPNSEDGYRAVSRIDPMQAAAMRKDRQAQLKTQGEIDKDAFDTASRRFGAFKQTMGSLSKAPNLTLNMVMRAGQQMVQMGVMPQSMFDDGIADLPEDPAQLRAALEDDLRTQLTPEQMFSVFAPKVEYKSDGQQLIPVQTNPNAPGYKAPTPIRLQQSPESVASQATTRRGQDMTDARAREFNASQGNTYDPERGVVVNTRSQTATPVTSGGQPLKGKDKPMTEGQAKANLFGSRAQAADEILSKLAKDGVEQPGLIKRIAGSTPLVGGGLAATTNFTQSNQQQQVEQAQRDFINAVLRKESGAVIGADEFANAQQQYFPQLGDGAGVIKQKAANRQLAIQGILAEVPGNAPANRGVTVDY